MLTHELMMDITDHMPMKQIDVNGQPYLQRYYVGRTYDGSDLWLHRFITADGDRHLHSHPFTAFSTVLVGEYYEIFREHDRADHQRRHIRAQVYGQTVLQMALVGQPPPRGRPITPFNWHRIAGVQPNTWTLFEVLPGRLPFWYFDNGGGDIEAVKSSPPDWWKHCGVRNGNLAAR
jgi:hypothetical protein